MSNLESRWSGLYLAVLISTQSPGIDDSRQDKCIPVKFSLLVLLLNTKQFPQGRKLEQDSVTVKAHPTKQSCYNTSKVSSHSRRHREKQSCNRLQKAKHEMTGPQRASGLQRTAMLKHLMGWTLGVCVGGGGL